MPSSQGGRYGQFLREAHSLLFDASKEYVNVDFLMPNGISLTHLVNTTSPLDEIKAEIWEKAYENPLFGLLHDQTTYHFAYLSSKAENLELLDETQSLRKLNPFTTILKVVERAGNEEEKKLNSQIGELIGKGLKDFDDLKNPEVNDFRWKMRNECDEIVRRRNELPWRDQVLYQHPCNLAPSAELPQYILDKLPENRRLKIKVRIVPPPENVEIFKTIPVNHDIVPSKLLHLFFSKLNNTNEGDEECMNIANDHILKNLGREEYLVCEVPLSRYMAIRNYICSEQKEFFTLTAVPKDTINVEVDEIYRKIDMDVKPNRSSISASTLNKKKSNNLVSSWTVKEDFKITIHSLGKVNVESEESSEVLIEAGLYHAGVALCKTVSTSSFSIQDGSAKIDCELEFPIQVCNIPRSSRLCLGVYEQVPVNPKMKTKSVSNLAREFLKTSFAWVNTSVYDYRGHLKSGSMTLYCWNFSEERLTECIVPHPLGTVVSNPKHNSALAITVTFAKYSTTVVFPTKEIIIALAKNYLDTDEQCPDASDESEIRQIRDRDPLAELHEQERKKIWTYRRFCMNKVPEILSKLLQCVEWNNNEEVAEMLLILENWPKLSPNFALELLDYAYAEPAVRSFAIDCLVNVSNEDLLLYLLQLVQALKYENYLYCDIVQFLLQRALNNRMIGHFFFWHLRSEMHMSSVSIRFGLILEAYCRGAVEHMKLLQRQVNAISKFSEIQNSVKRSRNTRDTRAILQEALSDQANCSVSYILNPIDPALRAGKVRIKKCKAMSSKMQPLWLVFENSNDPKESNDIYLLYKKGDDIRQDMLTLQMIRVMDKLWKDHGLDLRMNTYRCLATNYKEGIIQIVHGAQTIAKIQAAKGTITSTFKQDSLLQWLREQNTTEESLDKAIKEFTLSCAGYSVATYILGIADRHNDNIMIMPSGQLFHIDFGHILGHFKEKFGIRRERQPFVLAQDFINVIQKGKKDDSKSEYFKQFQTCCEEAFMLMRRHGTFIISLFAMMVSTGLPELQSEKDLDYLKETLKLDLNEMEARVHFNSKFKEALSNTWSTSINWSFHHLAKK